MMSSSKITPTLPAVDLNRARKFYHETLGLKISMEEPMGIFFESRDGSTLYLYERGPTKADHTVAAFDVEDIDAEVRDLRSKGIKFEEYDIPSLGVRTVNGISTRLVEGYESKSAWFKDTEGNILALNQMVKARPATHRGKPERVAVRG